MFRSKLLNVSQLTFVESADEDVEVSLVGSRDKRDPLAIRRKSWLHVDRSARGELHCPPIARIQRPEFYCVVIVTVENHPPSIDRPVWLIVVAWARCQLLCFR